MSDSNGSKPVLLARLDFPPYCMKVISERHILIAGGGGSSKTGVPNCIDIYELVYDPVANTGRVNLVTRYDNEDRAIMNLDIVPKSKYQFELLTGGSDGSCYVHDVKLKLNSSILPDSSNVHSPNDANLRRRHFSFSTQQSKEDDIEENLGGDADSQRNPSGPSKGPANAPQAAIPNLTVRRDSKNKGSQSSSSSTANSGIPEYTFEFVPKKSFQTDFHEKDPYQKLIKYSPAASFIFSAGSEGMIRFWSFPKYERISEVGAHENEVDDMDIHPAGTHLISVSRDGRNNVWSTYTAQLVTTLVHDQAIPNHTDPKNGIHKVKYVAKKCRYGTVDCDETNVRLFLILNPVPRSNNIPSYIAKWHVNNEQYRLEKFAPAGHNLSALGISDNGRFLATGTNDGDIDVFVSFSLQRIYRVAQVHKFFVSGVEFLPATQTSLELVGDEAEIALISVSGDKQIVMHKIPKRATLGFLGSFLFFVFFMFCIYLAMNVLDL